MDVVLSIAIICGTIVAFSWMLFSHLAIKAHAKAKLIEAAAEVVSEARDLIGAVASAIDTIFDEEPDEDN